MPVRDDASVASQIRFEVSEQLPEIVPIPKPISRSGRTVRFEATPVFAYF